MRWLGQSHVQSFNANHGRCGTLWQGRFKACLVDNDRHVLTVLRYIELNPLRAAMVGAADDYHWSSVHAHLGRVRDPRLTPHPAYLVHWVRMQPHVLTPIAAGSQPASMQTTCRASDGTSRKNAPSETIAFSACWPRPSTCP